MSTIHEWLRDREIAPRYRVGSLRAFAEQVRAGADFRFVLREFLDDINLAAAVRPGDLAQMIQHEPSPLEHRGEQVFLGALAEHVAMLHGLERPLWAVAEDRFLTTWWFPVDNKAYDAVAIRESPPAFRRRGIFLPASILERV